MAKRSAEQRLRDEWMGCAPHWRKRMSALLREVKRECAERVLPLFDDPSTWSRSNQSLKNAVRAAILGGPRRG